MKQPISIAENRDCMEAMKEFPDKFFELAVVDPPYGIGASTKNFMKQGKQTGKSLAISGLKYKASEWDSSIPDKSYFQELMRVSRHQIIWGGNYFNLGITSCYIVWDKDNSENKYADCELAWTNFNTAIRKVRIRWHGMLQENMANKQDRIHPTEKPFQLYSWLLKNYAKPGDKILDTHLGSGSSRIAAYKLGFDFWGYEIDAEYWLAQEKRFKTAIAEPLFDNIKVEQAKLL